MKPAPPQATGPGSGQALLPTPRADLGAADILDALVRIPSVTGSEAAAVAYLQALARADGLRVVTDAAGNFIADAGHGPRHLLFVGHVDTVAGDLPVRRTATELWGRGSVDAKGPLVAAYCAARNVRDSSQVSVRVVGAVDEEGASRGALGLDLSRRPDWLVVGEPSGVHAVTLAYKGILRGRFRAQAPRRHGAHAGATAADLAFRFWREATAELALEDRFATLQGHLVGLQSGGDDRHETVVGRFQFRLPPGKACDDLAAHLRAVGAGMDVAVWVDEAVDAAAGDKRSPLVGAFLGAMRARGAAPRLLQKTGTADFNHLVRRLPGVPVVAYGPGDAALDHTPDERIELAEFEASIGVLDDVIASLAALPVAPSNAALAAPTG